jgi:hypothetical protein
MSHNGGMAKRHYNRTVCWSLFAAYVAYLIGLALVEPLVTNHTLSAAVVQCLWYSLASAAVAVGCWISLGDGNGVLRLIVGAWSLICVWIVWIVSIQIYSIREPGEPGSTTEGFTVYATGHAIIALAIVMVLLGPIRLTTGLRLIRDSQLGPLIPSRRSFTLIEFLCGVAVVATTLGAARLVAPRDFAYFEWFTMPKEVLNFHWIWTYTSIIAVPTSLMLVYPRRIVLAASYFLATVCALVLQKHWSFVGKAPFSAWQFYWVTESLWMAHVVAHVAALMALLKYLGYSLTWNLRLGPPAVNAAVHCSAVSETSIQGR